MDVVWCGAMPGTKRMQAVNSCGSFPLNLFTVGQEASRIITFWTHVSIPIEITYSEPTLRAIVWYINESILRGSGGVGEFRRLLQNLTGPLS